MAASLIVSTAPPGPAHRRAAAVVTMLLLLAAALIGTVGTRPMTPRAGFLPAFGGMMLLGDLITAVLLFSQARAARDRATADLATAYLFSTCAIVPHLLAFPGVFADAPLIGASASAVWLWCVWHAGFALCVARYAWRRGRLAGGPIRLGPILATVGACVLAATLVTTLGLPWLPDVLQGGAFGGLNRTGVGPFVALCNVAALSLVVLRLRGRTVVDLWLAVAMLTATLDVLLTLYSGGRYTLGWYAARMLSLGTGITVLAALLCELTRLFGRLSELNEHLQRLSVTDGLTQIANRRGFDDALERAWRDAEREETAISLLMVDIDLFKGFNDTYGHPAGDECLRRVASLINSHARRPYDVAARLGGEEFALLMPRTEEAGAATIAARLRAGIEGLLIPNEASRLGHITISGGIATLRPTAQRDGAAVLTEAADRALYRAKQGGRNRIATWQDIGGTLAPASLGLAAGQ
jgi:diguanylate cyclase (GGDEF)-like protein